MAKQLYVFYGEETYLIDQAVHELKRKLLEPAWEAFGFQLIDTSNSTTDNIINAIQTIPAFSPVRLVLLKNPRFLSGRNIDKLETELLDRQESDQDGNRENQSLAAEEEELLLNSLENLPAGVTVIIQADGSIDFRRRFGKFFKNNATELKEFKSFNRWERTEVLQWIKSYLQAKGFSITEETADFIAELTGHSLSALHNELEKIITYAGKQKNITLQEVKAILSQGELSYYDLGAALRQKDIKTLLFLTGRLAKDGEKPQAVLGFLAAQVRFLLQLKEMQQQRMSYAEMAGAVRKHPYYIQKIVEKELSRYTWTELKNLYYELQKADLNGKTGLMSPFLAMEMALASFVK
jgi:DNA polymerase-3 subunit delta